MKVLNLLIISLKNYSVADKEVGCGTRGKAHAYIMFGPCLTPGCYKPHHHPCSKTSDACSHNKCIKMKNKMRLFYHMLKDVIRSIFSKYAKQNLHLSYNIDTKCFRKIVLLKI